MYNVEKRLKELNKKKDGILAKKQEIIERFDNLIAEVNEEIEKLNQSEQELGRLTKRQVEIMDNVNSMAQVSAKEKQEGVVVKPEPENILAHTDIKKKPATGSNNPNKFINVSELASKPVNDSQPIQAQKQEMPKKTTYSEVPVESFSDSGEVVTVKPQAQEKNVQATDAAKVACQATSHVPGEKQPTPEIKPEKKETISL